MPTATLSNMKYWVSGAAIGREDSHPRERENEPTRFWHARPLSRWLLIAIAVIVIWSFSTDLLSLVTERDGGGGQPPLPIAITSLAALSFGPLVAAVRSTYGSVIVFIGAGMQIFYELPLLAIVVVLATTFIVALTASKVFARAQVIVSAAWILVHILLVPGNQLLFWGFIPTLLVLHAVGTHLAGLRRENLRARRHAEQLAGHQLAAIESERRNIARDLHDIVAHDMTIVAMQADAARVSKDPNQVSASLDAIADATHQSLHDLRVMMKVLAASSPDQQRSVTPVSDQSLHRELEAASERLAGLGYDVELVITGEPDSLLRAVQIALVPVIRECATNVIKHTSDSGPKAVTFAVSVGANILVEVTSGPVAEVGIDGSGVPSGGFGMVCLAERLQLLGGTFQAGRDGDTWTVRASLDAGASRHTQEPVQSRVLPDGR